MAGPVPFVGREGELSRLLAALGGGVRLVLVTGDAGVGKTRFVAEGIARAAAAGMMPVRGECSPLAETLPLLPIAEAMGELARLEGGGLMKAGLAAAPEYVRGEAGRLLPGLDADAGPGPGQRNEGWQRERLFSAVAAWLAQVRGSARVEEIRLGPLSRPEVAQQVTALAGGRVSPGVVDGLYERAEGNPFFTEQLVAAGLTAGGGDDLDLPAGLPGRLAELLAARTERCTGAARAVLAGLALAGRPLDEELLRAVTGLDGEAVRGGLRELTAARLLAEDTAGGGHRPRHRLLAEAVTGALLPGERAALHERTARALAAAGDDHLAAEVAEHWQAAGTPDEELPARVVAAEAAEPAAATPPPAQTAPPPYGLTDRELAVLRLVATGRTNAQIGAEESAMIDHHTETAQRPDSLHPTAPLAVRNAAWVMYAAAVASLVLLVVDIATSGATKTVLGQKHPNLSAATITTLTNVTVIAEAIVAVISAALFVWLARECLAGKNWARITATVLCGLGILGAFIAVSTGRSSAVLIVGFVLAGIRLVLLPILWQGSSNAYFQKFRRA